MKSKPEAKEACNASQGDPQGEQQQQRTVSLTCHDPTAGTIEEEDDDDEKTSPAPTFSFCVARKPGSQSGSLQLSPCHQSVSCLICRLF
jgi:hypothetical protein